MLVVACPAPSGPLDPAPLTSMSLPGELDGDVRAFWAGDDYLVERSGAWFRISPEQTAAAVSHEERQSAAEQALAVIPLGPGRVAFPVGSAGRTVYRVWRAGRTARNDEVAPARRARIRILGVRAGRSLRQPA